MFTNSDILTLARAGFSAAQIAALSTVQPQTQQAQPPQQQQAQQQQAQQQPDRIDELVKAVAGLTATVQAGNLSNAQQPNGGGAETVDSILANIVNPQS